MTTLRSLDGLVTTLDGAAPIPRPAVRAVTDVSGGSSGGLVDRSPCAEYRHVAWDVGHLAVPWPSCWCSWRLPDDLAAAALGRYRDAVDMRYVGTARFGDDLARAVTGWALLSTAWFAANALGDDPAPSDPRIVAPPRRAMILHRLDRAAQHRVVEPELAELAGSLRDAFACRWGELPLEYAPAFRGSPD